MDPVYRDETDSLRARNAELESRFAEGERRIQERERACRGINVLLGAALALGGLGIVTGTVVLTNRHLSVIAPPLRTQVAGDDPCARVGVRLTVGGEAVEASAWSDVAVHYRANSIERLGDVVQAADKGEGDLSLGSVVYRWMSEGKEGPYVSAVSADLPHDSGMTSLRSFAVETKGARYSLARDGTSHVDVLGADGKQIWGRFEADMSRVENLTYPPPIGAPVSRMRGTFCLPIKASVAR